MAPDRQGSGVIPSATIFSDRWAELGESPVWSETEDCIWWVDIEGCRLLRTQLSDGRTESWDAPEPVGCIALLASGRLIAGLATGVFDFDRSSGRFERICRPDPRDDVRFNDGALDPAGRFWAGTMHRDITEPAGAIFCVEADFTSRRVFDGLWTPNGIAFDAARGRMYFSDSHPAVQTIWVCDYDAETADVDNRRVFATTHAIEARPDGAFVDEDGIYWIAGVGGSQILRFLPDGVPLPPIPVPVTHPTKMARAGTRPGSLFVTSRRQPDSAPGNPSGHLLQLVLD
jgi:sugar lactone lactonase YvrE